MITIISNRYLPQTLLFVLMSLSLLPEKCPVQVLERLRNYNSHRVENKKKQILTSLSFTANITAPACSAAFPTIGSRITLINATGMFIALDVP